MKKLFAIFSMVMICFFTASAEKQTNYRTALVMAYSPTNNVYEDDNIKLEIYNEKLYATNKTNKTIFIDLSQCFLIHNGSSYPMYSAPQDDKKASKKNISTSIDEYISIAPAVGTKQNETFVCNMANGLYGEYTTTESPSGNFSEYEERLLSLVNEMVNESLEADPKGKQYLGTAHRHLTEDESINNIGITLAYAFSKKAEEWTPVALSTWVSDVYLAPYYVEMPKELNKKDKRGFGIKKTEAAKIHIRADQPFEFESDRSPVIATDWEGEFKKGKFDIKRIWVKKKEGKGFGKILFSSLATIATGGATAFLFMNDEETFYKREVLFTGMNEDWGKMKYMDDEDFSKFNNK